MTEEPYLTPAARLLGGEYVDWDGVAGLFTMTFRPGTEFANSEGNVHGGFMAAMLDIALGSTINARLPEGEPFGATLNLNVSYLRRLPAGVVIAESRIVRRGRSVVFIEGSLRAEDRDEPAATATMTLYLPA